MPVIGGVVVMVVAGAAVAWFAVTRGSSAEQPDIWGARDGTVPGLVLLNDSFKRWWVDSLETSNPPVIPRWSGSATSSGQCQPRLTQHWGRVTLAEPLGDRRVVSAPIDYPPGTDFFRNG